MDAWLDVVLPSESGAFKCRMDSFSLLFCNCSRNLRWLENCKTMGSKITKVTSFEELLNSWCINFVFYRAFKILARNNTL
jgi:hypothetical protein